MLLGLLVASHCKGWLRAGLELAPSVRVYSVMDTVGDWIDLGDFWGMM